jgi:hypothetical protein
LFDQRVEIWIQYASVALETVERYASLEVAQTESQKQNDRRTERLNTHKNNISKKPSTPSVDDQKTKELSDQLEQVLFCFATCWLLHTVYTKSSIFLLFFVLHLSVIITHCISLKKDYQVYQLSIIQQELLYLMSYNYMINIKRMKLMLGWSLLESANFLK